MSFFDWLLNRKREEKVEMPDHLKVVYTREAEANGTFDEFNKEILEIKNGIVVSRTPYSIQELVAMVKVKNLPVDDRTRDEEEDFEFTESIALSGMFTEAQRY